MERSGSVSFGFARHLRRGSAVAAGALALISACAGKSTRDREEPVCEACGARGGTSGRGGTGGTAARGGTGGKGGSGGVTPPGDAGVPIPACEGTPPEAALRRLTSTDIDRTLDHALGEGPALEGTWPAHRIGARGVVTEAEARGVVRMARARARAFAAASPRGCDLEDSDCLDGVLVELGYRLYRRPLLEGERRSLEILFAAQGEDASAETRLAAVVEAMIASPTFLFRVELGNGTLERDGSTPLTGFELAARLAFFLWRSGPDDLLLQAAGADALATPEGIENEALRMLRDPRALFGLETLTREWLELAEFDARAESVGLPDAIRADMNEQTTRFLAGLFGDTGATLDRLLLATNDSLTPALAEHYGTSADFEVDAERFSGILTHGTLLVSAPSISRRGAVVRRSLLCTDLSPPPPNLPTTVPENPTFREPYEALVENAPCAGCHLLLDPIGFGLAGFDELGRGQEQPLDGYVLASSGEEAAFVGARGLAGVLVHLPEVSACTVERWLEYALDRAPGAPPLMLPPGSGAPIGPGAGAPIGPASTPACLTSAFELDGHDLPRLAVAIAKSAPFRRIARRSDGYSPGVTGSTVPLAIALDATESLRAAYQTNDAALAELTAYREALLAILRDGGGTGEGGAGGAGP